MTNIIPAAISQLQESFFRTVNADGDTTESTSTHPCHCLSIPAARLFWCRHCMQIFEDPITRWRHSKTCLHSSGKMRKDKEGSTMQVFLGANNLAELRREQNKSRAINNRSSIPRNSHGTDLRCFICKTSFASIEEMRAHVRTPCRKRPTLLTPKHEYLPMPTEVKTQIQIPESASEIIYIKDGHQTVISLQSPYQTNIVEQAPETQIATVETVIPVLSKNEDVAKQVKSRNENKENSTRKRRRILQKELDDLPSVKSTSLSPKSDQQVVTLGLSTKTDDDGDVLDNFESPPIKVSKVVNQDHAEEEEEEVTACEVPTQPLQTSEAFGQLLSPEKKDHQPPAPSLFLEANDSLQNRVITEQIPNESTALKIPNLPVEEKIVTGDAAEARLKDLFTTMEMQNANKLSPPPQPLQVTCPFPEIQNKDVSQNEVSENEGQSSTFSVEEEIDPSGLLLYMPPINAGSVTLPDPLIDLQSGLPAEMLLDETTNTKPAVLPPVPEAMNGSVRSNMIEATKLPSHIFDGDLLPSHIHSDVLFEEMADDKEAFHHVKGLAKLNAEESTSDVEKVAQGVTESYAPVGEALSVEVVSTGIATPVKEAAAQSLDSVERIPLPAVVDHVEEIAQPFLVDMIGEASNEVATAVPIKEVTASVEAAAVVESVAQVLETTAIETLPSVEEVAPVESVSLVQESSLAEIGSPDDETIPVKTLTPTPGIEPDVDKKTVETVNQTLEPTPSTVRPLSPTEAVSLIEASTPVKAVSPVHASIPAEAMSSTVASTPTEDLSQIEVSIIEETVSPVLEISAIEDQDASKVTELVAKETMSTSDTAVERMENLEQATSLKTSEENPEIPSEGSPLVPIKNEEPVLPIDKSSEISNEAAEANLEEMNDKTKGKEASDDDELETSLAEKADRETKFKSTKLFKCKACSNTFKTPQALQKHSRVPCKVKHTRSLSQKILRPKQPCLKIEKKPMKKKLIKPTRRPKLLIPIIPITRSELIRPAVPRRPKRFSRRKRKKVFFMDEQHHILPFVNVLMSELSDKDRFFYKLGMMNQCHKISGSSDQTTTMGTAANDETSVVEIPGDSTEQSPSDVQSSGVKTELPTPPLQISLLSSAEIVADESQGISSAAFLESGSVSDKENSEGPCLSVPSTVKMEGNQFYDPSSDHRKVNAQSPCWEAAPRLAQLPGVMEIVRVTSANPSSTDKLAASNATNKASLEGNPNNVLANCQSLPFCDSDTCIKERARKLSKESITAKKVALKCEADEEPFKTVFQNGDSMTDTTSISFSDQVIKEEPRSDVVKREIDVNTTDNDLNKKTKRKSNPVEADNRPKATVENKKHLKNAKIHSGINKNSTRCKMNVIQMAKKNLVESINLKNSLNKKDQKDSVCMMSRPECETRENERSSTNRNVSNSQRKSSTSSLTLKKSSDKARCGPSSKMTGEKTVPNVESPKAALDFCTNVVLNKDNESPAATVLSSPVSLRKQTRSQQATLKKDKDALIIPNSKDCVMSSPQNKMSSMLTISTRSSPHRKAVGKHVPQLPLKNLNSVTETKRQSPRSQKPENVIRKKHASLKDKIISKTAQNNNSSCNHSKNSLHIKKLSEQNLKKKMISTLSEKLSISNKKSQSQEATKLNSKGSKPAKPCSKKSSVSPNRITRRTQKNHDSKALLKSVGETSKRNRTLSANDLKSGLKKSPDHLHHKEDSFLSKNKSREKVSKNQKEIFQSESALPISETTPPKLRTVDGKFATRIRQRSGSPCTKQSDLASTPHRRTRSKSDQGTIGNSSVSEGRDLILENSLSSHVSRTKSRNIKELVTNSVSVNSDKETSTVSEQVCPQQTSDTMTFSISEPVYPQHASNKEISSVSEQIKQEPKNSLVIGTLQTHELKNSAIINTLQTHEPKNSAVINTLQTHEPKNSAVIDTLQTHEPKNSAVINTLQTHEPKNSAVIDTLQTHEPKNSAVIDTLQTHEPKNSAVIDTLQTYEPKNSAVIDISQTHESKSSLVFDTQECDLTLTMKSTTNETIHKREELKDDIKSPFPAFVNCHLESARIGTTPEQMILDSGGVDAHKTEVTVSHRTLTSDLGCGDGDGINDTVTNPCPVKCENLLHNVAVVNSNPRISIATQTDSSFIHDTKAGVVIQSDSCSGVENKEIPSDPNVPIPSPPATDTTLISAKDVPKENLAELSQENLNHSAGEKPFSVEVDVGNDDDHQLSPVAPSFPVDPCQYVQNEVVLQENVELANDPMQQPNPNPMQQSVILPAETESPLQQQQLMVDGTADHNALIQYLSSLDPSLLQQGVTFVIIQGTSGETPQDMDGNNFVVDQTAFAERAEQELDNSSVIYALQQQSDIVVNETEVLTMDST